MGQSGEVSDSNLFGVSRAVVSLGGCQRSFWPTWRVQSAAGPSGLTRKWRAGWAWLESLKIWWKSFKLTFVDLKWRQIQTLHGLFLSSNVFRNTFQWTILVQYEIGFWTAAMTVCLWISGENEPMWRVRPISCRFSFLGQHYRLAPPAVIEMYYVSSPLVFLVCTVAVFWTSGTRLIISTWFSVNSRPSAICVYTLRTIISNPYS